MTPTERIQLISELRRSFPAHKLLQEALADYERLAIAANRPKATTSRAIYMREHRKKERALIRQAKHDSSRHPDSESIPAATDAESI